jgi:hypothetical protein
MSLAGAAGWDGISLGVLASGADGTGSCTTGASVTAPRFPLGLQASTELPSSCAPMMARITPAEPATDHLEHGLFETRTECIPTPRFCPAKTDRRNQPTNRRNLDP